VFGMGYRQGYRHGNTWHNNCDVQIQGPLSSGVHSSWRMCSQLVGGHVIMCSCVQVLNTCAAK
jgi:hypothetical protein